MWWSFGTVERSDTRGRCPVLIATTPVGFSRMLARDGRASGSDGYNEYIYDLGGVASVTTLVTTEAAGADADEVEERILRAEGIFIAGGDQWDYVSMWNNTRLSRAVQHCITNKTVTLGGTSAGERSAGSTGRCPTGLWVAGTSEIAAGVGVLGFCGAAQCVSRFGGDG